MFWGENCALFSKNMALLGKKKFVLHFVHFLAIFGAPLSSELLNTLQIGENPRNLEIQIEIFKNVNFGCYSLQHYFDLKYGHRDHRFAS